MIPVVPHRERERGLEVVRGERVGEGVAPPDADHNVRHAEGVRLHLQQRVVRERTAGPSCPQTPAGGLSTWYTPRAYVLTWFRVLGSGFRV